ncbi:hypothetical protein HXP44_21055 [Streptomyces sioyaensis]|uniref:Uncharacterized protein n=1 Tax=Streptomyces sioyaensis TaxID=67364 RepID=A0A4Q1R1H2_9ACTN|nr:hypothetical protein [Streptomyces sioyaensis]MBM4794488.1 hypothetical protein [Streptomyces sioyaensis]RXS64849.1 hypothetical protein EST54_20700 [Streptomyces sioyaensis]
MHTETITVTPDICINWMKNRVCNRVPLRSYNVEKFREILQTGQFRTTHQGFALDLHGCLIDGQHRAQAIIDTGISVTAQVTYDLAPDAFAAIDGGRVRTAGDHVAQATGMAQNSANYFGAALKILRNRAEGLHWTRWSTGKITADEIPALMASWPIPESLINYMLVKGRQCHASGTGLLISHQIILEKWPKDVADLFFRGIGDASREYVGKDPRAVYTNTMLNVNKGVISRDSVQQSAQAIKAFNALVAGETIGTLKKMKMGGVKVVRNRETGEEMEQQYLADRYPGVIDVQTISQTWLHVTDHS